MSGMLILNSNMKHFKTLYFFIVRFVSPVSTFLSTFPLYPCNVIYRFFLIFIQAKPQSAVKLFDRKMSRAIKESQFLTKTFKPKTNTPKKVGQGKFMLALYFKLFYIATCYFFLQRIDPKAQTFIFYLLLLQLVLCRMAAVKSLPVHHP